MFKLLNATSVPALLTEMLQQANDVALQGSSWQLCSVDVARQARNFAYEILIAITMVKPWARNGEIARSSSA